MFNWNSLRTCISVTTKYTGAAYLGYKVVTIVESRIQKKGSHKPQPRPSRFNDPNNRWIRWGKQVTNNKLVKIFLNPVVLGPLSGIACLKICEDIIGPLIQAYTAKSLFDDCFDEKLWKKYNIKPLILRLKEDDWPTDFPKLPNEMELEEKAQICGLLHEDVSTLDPTASKVHFILSCILFLSDLDTETYESLLTHLLRLLRSGKLSRKLRKYILMLLLRRGYHVPKSIYLLLKS